MIAKKWWESRTLWVNVGTLVVVALGLILDAADVFDLTPQVATILTIVLALANSFLRMVTAQPIAGTPASRKRPPRGPG